MKSAIFLLLIGASCALGAPSIESLKAAFEDFKLSHGKQYSSVHEELKRFEIFSQNLQEIQKFNKEESAKAGYTRGVNRFTDMEVSELQHLFGLKKPNKSLNAYANEDFVNSYLNIQDGSNLTEVDWRKTPGRVSEVKNQDLCGSCWAFATTGLLEGQETKSGLLKKFTSLSEQNLVDCSYLNNGCRGGLMIDALEEIQLLGGIESEADYSYEGKDEECRFNKEKSVLTTKGGVVAGTITEKNLAKLVKSYGPVAIAIRAGFSEFLSYQKGVFAHKNCSSSPDMMDHGVLIVGFGTDSDHGDYWIVKNSWGDYWGEDGYIRIARNKNNMCGVTNMPTLAKL